MERFDDIRPYNDQEVRPVLNRLLQDQDLISVLSQHQLPRLNDSLPGVARWLIRLGLKNKTKGVNDIEDFQHIVEPYLTGVIESTASAISFSGLENLDPSKAYTFLSNHRDIAMDPALVNLALHRAKRTTVRIAIGDNLLQKPFVSDIMRLNKSFIVKRSVAGRREKLRAFQELSAYIHDSIDTGHPIWIAQSEGRAKDGNDRTDSAIIKMFHMSRKDSSTTFADSICSMNIVPVSISYELDPCDQAKARELYETEQLGSYQKEQGEDLKSIVAGIEGSKGHIHVAFGQPLTDEYANANEVVAEVDRQIYQEYRLTGINLAAFSRMDRGRLQGLPEIETDELFSTLAPDEKMAEAQAAFDQRLSECPAEYHQHLIMMYAYPVINRLSIR
ncbi:glycerol acyltransferase [Endozoicomonas sp. OPT23]|uniref:1-acyl-sn-glycerol-3-phosphate acyltransferase n=1 Tax=Endozoicomonas sp. OPT23 TaxID=2072845 RepID=UPI00129B0F34|nr:1-acyl-sn-glycerol-3-phosphate acyltransferase [Endozoicomonas sp. OPT23]MRI34522.1 glycerol acyltransferase [Endozoicomonas sp. OPT23]